jgi:hypothetical protein
MRPTPGEGSAHDAPRASPGSQQLPRQRLRTGNQLDLSSCPLFGSSDSLWTVPSGEKTKGLKVGDLVARVEALHILHRVTEKHPGYVRILPYRRSGKEHFLAPMRYGAGTIWAGDGAQWVWTGRS